MMFVSNKAKYRFALLFSISFILNGYSSGLPGISLGSVVFITYIFYSLIVILKHNKLITFGKRGINLSSLGFVLFIFMITLLTLLFNVSNQFSLSNLIFTLLKILTWAFMISITNYIFFDYYYICMWMFRIANILTVYIIIQTIAFYIFSLYIPNIYNFGILKPYDELYAAYDLLGSGVILRPGSLLSEPAFYGNYILCVLTMLMFSEQYGNKKKDIFLSIFYSLGTVLSTSTSAIYLLVILWLCYFYCKGFKKLLIIGILSIATFTIFALFIAFDFEIIISKLGYFGNAILLAIEKIKYYSTSSRIGRSYGYINLLNFNQRLLGIGIGNEQVFIKSKLPISGAYLNSLTTLIFWAGYFGVLAYALYIISIIKKAIKDKISFILLMIYIVKGFSSGIWFSTYGILFMTIIIFRSQYYNSLHRKYVMG